MSKRILICVLAVILTGVLGGALQLSTSLNALAQQRVECLTFNETGKAVCGKFLVYWREHGGLPQHGYPISKEFVEISDLNSKPYTVQYFERAVIELHPENQPPYDVLLSQIGTFQFRRKYPKGDSNVANTTPTLPPNLLIYPASPRVEQGKPYPFSIYTHCGLDAYLDFDGSLWDSLDPTDKASGRNPPPGVSNPGQLGTMTLIDEGHAKFEFNGRRFYFHRHVGPKPDPGCF